MKRKRSWIKIGSVVFALLISTLAGTPAAHAGFWEWFDELFGIAEFGRQVGKYHGARSSNYIGPTLISTDSKAFKDCKALCMDQCHRRQPPTDGEDSCDTDCEDRCMEQLTSGLKSAVSKFKENLEQIGITEATLPTRLRFGDFTLDLETEGIMSADGSKTLKTDDAGNPAFVEETAISPQTPLQTAAPLSAEPFPSSKTVAPTKKSSEFQRFFDWVFGK